jgi:hypothetical protein
MRDINDRVFFAELTPRLAEMAYAQLFLCLKGLRNIRAERWIRL